MRIPQEQGPKHPSARSGTKEGASETEGVLDSGVSGFLRGVWRPRNREKVGIEEKVKLEVLNMGKGSAANGCLANNSATGSADITETRPRSLLEDEEPR